MIDFLSGLCAGLACAGLGALTMALWLWRGSITPPPQNSGQLIPIRTKTDLPPNRRVV